jgi:bacillithiol biosynthesis cysteine-adding enzyme BshC
MSDCITYQQTQYFSDLITDYIQKNPKVEPFYNRFPELSSFEEQMIEKHANFPSKNREVLVEVLLKQYTSIATTESTINNVKSLLDVDTFTITTGHQLNLFTGPIYFIYKIVSTIKLCNQLQLQYPDKKFVPVYWMASEDHDFEEISFFNFQQKKYTANQEQQGKVGAHPTENLEAVFNEFDADLGVGEHANYLRKLFQKAYLYHNSYVEATRYLVNQLFKEYGLVILDADNKDLKRIFIPQFKNELFHQSAHQYTADAIEKLQAKDYNIQVNPREINLFYIRDEVRERIIFKDDIFFVNETKWQFTKDELLTELSHFPERFSPNVMTRPLYQEAILPNLCYIGGGGELAYWFQLKPYFEAEKIPFPILLLRNSALLYTQKQAKKIKNLDLQLSDFFQAKHELATQITHQISDITIDFSTQKEHLQKQFEALHNLVHATDKSFKGAVAAQEHKQLKGLAHLEKRLLKAQKIKLKDQLNRVDRLQLALFPSYSLQERFINFSEIYLLLGKDFIPRLLSEFDPLALQFNLIQIEK